VTEQLCLRCLEIRVRRPGFGEFVSEFRHPKRNADRCPYCLRTVATIEETGLVGCALCYEVVPEAVLVRFGARPIGETPSYVS
jgi:hypothetical protein